MAGGDDWQRLADAAIARRVHLGYRTREAFAEAAFISSRTLGDIERYRRVSYDPATLAQLEQALRWSPGSVAAVLAGGDPTPLPAEVRRLPEPVARLYAAYERLDPRDRDDADRMVGLVAEWVEARAGRDGGVRR